MQVSSPIFTDTLKIYLAYALTLFTKFFLANSLHLCMVRQKFLPPKFSRYGILRSSSYKNTDPVVIHCNIFHVVIHVSLHVFTIQFPHSHADDSTLPILYTR